MRRPRWLYLAALPAVLMAGTAAFVVLRVQHTLDGAKTAVAMQGSYPVETGPLRRIANPGFELVSAPANYVSGAYYQGKFYLCGPAGLSVFSVDGSLLKQYKTGIDLPAAALRQAVVGRVRGASEPELLLATMGEGLLIFTGQHSEEGAGSFRQIRPKDPDAREITALLPLASGELLMGTAKRGLLVYSGTGDHASGEPSLTTFSTQFAQLAVTALAADDSGFWVGTRNQGVMHWHAGQVDAFRTQRATMAQGFKTVAFDKNVVGGSTSNNANSGLPDDDVNAIAVRGEKVYVGTPVGVEEFTAGKPTRELARNVFAQALYADDDTLTIGSLDQGTYTVSPASTRGRNESRSIRPAMLDRSLPDGESASETKVSDSLRQFLPTETSVESGSNDQHPLYAVAQDGLRRQRPDGGWSAVKPISYEDRHDPATLSDRNISALAFAPDGGLWVGYFDRGLDVLSNDLQTIRHYEDDHLFCINRIVLDPRRNAMTVATANGLALFDAQGKPRQVLGKRDGLIADHVNDVAFESNEMVVATPAGLTFIDGGGMRSIYAFEGLVNNHVYALATRPGGNTLLAGTLGGISLLRDDSVKQNLTATNSGLKHNWVTAILPVEDGFTPAAGSYLVGTYGAGIMQLNADGKFTPIENVTRAMVINPNAMFSTDSHIFAGSLGQGLWVWSRDTSRWSQIKDGLPSLNVTAIAARDGEVYVGTENGLVRIAEKNLR